MMSSGTLHCVVDKKNVTLQSSTGWQLTSGPGRLKTSSGNLTAGAAVTKKSRSAPQLHVKKLSGTAVEWWLSLHNGGAQTLDITEIQLLEGELKLAGAGWRVAHHELFRSERYFDGFTLTRGGLIEPVEQVQGRFGLSENAPFPGIFFTHPERGTILIAVLSQDRAKPVWSLEHRAGKIMLTAQECFKGIPALCVEAGKEWNSERWVALFTSGSMEDAIEQYYTLLKKRVNFPGEKSILRKAVLWGSWNYNYRARSFFDITHDMIEANALKLATVVKGKPHFVMIDDGYQRGSSKIQDMKDWFATSLEIFHDDGTPPHDPVLFPHGMDGMARAIRKAGSLPALWATPRIRRNSPLAQAHPDWLLQLEGGRAYGKLSAYLDYSLPEVREYTRNAWRTIFQKWGYQGLKLDFWTMPFEVPYVQYRNKNRTAVELRNLFLQDVREFIPKNGFVLVAVVCNAGGNPFIGRYADATRMGMDIGDGTLAEVQQSAICATVASPYYRHDCLLGDADSLGWCPKNTLGQNRLWATMTLLSGAICEIGGDLTNPSPEALELLKTAAKFHKPSRRTRNELFTGSVSNMPANHLVLERTDGVYEAYLNWTIMPREVELPHAVRDLWTGQRIGPACRIPPQDAILFKR